MNILSLLKTHNNKKRITTTIERATKERHIAYKLLIQMYDDNATHLSYTVYVTTCDAYMKNQ